METLPKSVLASLPEERNAQSRFFASRLSHQLPQYFAWKLKPLSQGTDALQQIWGNQFLYAFSHFVSLYKPWMSELQPNRKNIACRTNLAVSNLVTPSTRNVYSSSTATSEEHKLKLNQGEVKFSNCKQNITTSDVDHIREGSFRKSCPTYYKYRTKKFRVKLQFVLENVRPSERGLAGVINNRLMDFDVINKNFRLSCFLLWERLWIQDYCMP